MSEARIESGGGTPQLDESINLQEKLQKLQIPGLSDEILGRILGNPQSKVDFVRDIDAVVLQTPSNPSEISRIELLYIKGYGQIDTPFGKLSFIEIRNHPKKDEILGGFKPSKQANYHEWEEQVAINRKNTELAGEQVAITLEAEAFDKEKKLRSQIEDIQKINGIRKPDIRELQQTALKNPPKELQGIDPAKIKDDTYNNILLADYYITHAKDIASKLTPGDAILFQNSINNLSDTLQRPRIAEFEKLTSSLVLGSARDTINERGASLIKEGYSKSVTWDPRERTISFQNERGEVKILETASIPPRERVQNSTLSISRDIAPNIADPARERNDTRRNIVAQIVPTIARDTREMLSGKMEDGSDITSPEIGGMLDNTLSHISLRNSQSAKLSRTMIETTGGVLRMEQGRLNTLAQDKSISNPLDPDIGSIRGTMARITAIMESLQKIQEKTTIEEENTQSNTLLWDKNARETLQLVTSLGYDELGQDNLDALIQGLRVRDGKKGIWSNPVFDMTDTFTRDQQIHSLRRFAEQSGGGEGLQNIKKQIQGNEEFRRKWRNPESWILQEQPKKTETP